MSNISIFLIYFLLMVGAMIIDLLFARIHFRVTKKHYRTHHFAWSRYLLFILLPFIVALFVTYLSGLPLGVVFIGFALVGTFLEWLIGYTYDQLMGERLWTYHRYAIAGYTSFLSIPVWGLAGVLFWLLVRIF